MKFSIASITLLAAVAVATPITVQDLIQDAESAFELSPKLQAVFLPNYLLTSLICAQN